jgi:sulfur carrier protein
MKIKVNGEERILEVQMNLGDLIEEEFDGKEARGIAVAVNNSIVPKQKWDTTLINEDDRIEIVHAVQGG